MKKISLSQQKIIAITVIILLALFIAWLVVYIPAQDNVSQLKRELAGVENQIHQIEALVEKGKTIDEGIRIFQERYQQLTAKFPPREEEGLKVLADFARKQNIEVVSTDSQGKAPCRGENQQEIEAEGKKCQVLLISMEMRGSYRDLVQYLETIKKELPVFITVERLSIARDGYGPTRLRVILSLNLYLLS